MRKETYTCTPEEFLKNARLPVRVMETEADMMEEIAQLMFDAIVAKPNNGKTVIICPVGPIAQYPILAEKINAANQDPRDSPVIAEMRAFVSCMA